MATWACQCSKSKSHITKPFPIGCNGCAPLPTSKKQLVRRRRLAEKVFHETDLKVPKLFCFFVCLFFSISLWASSVVIAGPEPVFSYRTRTIFQSVRQLLNSIALTVSKPDFHGISYIMAFL